MKRTLNCRWLVVLALAAAFLAGCASTKAKKEPVTEEQFNLDELLGEKKPQAETTAKAEDEAEVLKLLGVTKEEKAAPAAAKATTPPAEAEASALQKQLESKDLEIAALRSEVARKADRIDELQRELRELKTAQAATGGPTATGYEGKYQQALQTYESKEYREAIAMFESLLAAQPNHKLADNCQYWIGECRYALGEYEQAIADFQKVFGLGDGNKSDAAQLKLGLCYLRLGDRLRAKEEFQRLLVEYPKSEFAPRAQSYLDKLQ
ncbi:MAG: tetratricopeptide repeat protein [bacterium]|jgi:tol-pal system protein YbgF|nr:tetratricopeptide repeat protein [candidate division KSB1 bacterium]MDH7561214.1 tetratricopeptide repeat protein [bacterium]